MSKQNLKQRDTELLSAYVDGELSSVECREVAGLLSKNAGARLRVNIYQRHNEVLRHLYAAVIDEAIPEHLSCMIGAVETDTKVGTNGGEAASQKSVP